MYSLIIILGLFLRTDLLSTFGDLIYLIGTILKDGFFNISTQFFTIRLAFKLFTHHFLALRFSGASPRVSISIRTICCHVPRSKLLFTNGIVRLGPTKEARTCEWPLPSCQVLSCSYPILLGSPSWTALLENRI